MKSVSLEQVAYHLGITPQDVLSWEKKQLIKSYLNQQNQRVFNLEELETFYRRKNGQVQDNRYSILHSEDKTHFKAIELFAGAGGLALGMENAGIQHELLLECDRTCIETLQQNRPQWPILAADITQVDFSPFRHQIDLVSGGFPCQAFSHAGFRRGLEDVRGTLFFEFARCVQEVQPKLAIAENVKGLLTHQRGETLKIMLAVLGSLGYRSTYQVMRAQFLDVPQKRERLFIIATRQDLNLHPIFPEEKSYSISLREALENCPDSPGQQYNERKRQIMEQVPPGGNWRDLPLDLQKTYMKNSYTQGGGRTGFARRLAWDEPALTLTCSPSQTQTERCHPEETRPLTVREYARIQTFPDAWQFAGTVAQQYRQIGNAIPVNLGYYIGRSAIATLRGHQPVSVSLHQPQQLTIPGFDLLPMG
ncbi:DNA (cytosine-5-)-methyltransferase [Spirulina subsalsa]|uniref:DNA (cytosine-5-)-methyltransferase n=1 Tax=Spirulina subsalsa TaxID=54311 RepID=UPI0003121B91|nr:DNA (cytosine-5-)-methyltransferase [Spirulina subsalsa]